MKFKVKITSLLRLAAHRLLSTARNLSHGEEKACACREGRGEKGREARERTGEEEKKKGGDRGRERGRVQEAV